LLLASLALTPAVAAAAQDERPALVEVLGPTALQIPVRDVAQADVAADVLARQGKEAPISILTRKVTLADKSEAGWTKAFELTWVPDPGSEYGHVHIVIKPSLLPKAGEYAVTARAVGPVPKPSSGQRGAPPASGKDAEVKKQAEQAISFTFTRPSAVLQVASPIKMEVVRGDPFSSSSVTPREITLAEGSGENAVADLVVSAPEPLKQANGIATAGRVTVSGVPVAPGASAPAAIAVDGDMPLGTASSKLSFVSRQIAQPLSVTVEVLVRVWRGWLLAIIAIGIVAGHQIRVKLDKDVLDATAREGANRQVAKLAQLSASTRDKALRAKIQTIEIALRRAIEPDAEPAAITSAIEKATKDAAEALEAAETDRAELRTTLADAKAALGDDTDHLPDVAKAIDQARAHLVKADTLLKQGLIGDVRTELTASKAIANGDVARAITSATSGAAAMIRPLEPWGDRTLDAAKERALAKVGAVDGADAGVKIRAVLDLTRELRVNLFGLALDDVRKVAAGVRPALLPAGAAAVDRALAAIPDFASRDPDTRALGEFESHVRRLRATLADGLRASADGLAKKPDVGTLVDKGNFEAAAGVIIAARPPAERPLGAGGQAAPAPDVSMAAAARTVDPHRAARALPVTLTIDPLVAIAGSAVDVLLGGVTLGPGTTVNWTVDGQPHDTHEPKLRLVPGEESVTVAVKVVEGGVTVGAADIEIAVQPSAAVEAAVQRQRRRSATFWRTFWAGLLICATGYFIYAEAFVGTPKDFFIAFLWGFSVDVGFAKLLQLAPSKTLS
jgi:hypothetical protein